jgi:outer membrane lipoprotein-sorting protein
LLSSCAPVIQNKASGEKLMKFADRLKIFLLCSLMLVAACDLHSAKHSGSGAATETNAVDAMTASIQAQLGAKSYRARMESNYDGKTTAQTVEYVAPDRFRIVGPMNEMIAVGSTTYMKLPTGKWQKAPIDINQFVASFRDPKIIEEMRKNADVKFLGDDTVDGMPMKVYQYTVKNPLGSNITSASKAWISAADKLPRKMEVESEIEGKHSKTLITYSDYNTDIKIEPPQQ